MKKMIQLFICVLFLNTYAYANPFLDLPDCEELSSYSGIGEEIDQDGSELSDLLTMAISNSKLSPLLDGQIELLNNEHIISHLRMYRVSRTNDGKPQQLTIVSSGESITMTGKIFEHADFLVMDLNENGEFTGEACKLELP